MKIILIVDEIVCNAIVMEFIKPHILLTPGYRNLRISEECHFITEFLGDL